MLSDTAGKRKEMKSSESLDNDEVVGEKENEDLWNDGGGDAASKKHRSGAEHSHIRIANGQTMNKYVFLFVILLERPECCNEFVKNVFSM